MDRLAAVVGCSVAAVSSVVAAWALYKWCSLKSGATSQHSQHLQQEVQKQLIHHYVDVDNLTQLKDIIPSSAEDYSRRLADYCNAMCSKYGNTKCKVLDIGSGAGGIAFHLSKYFDEVIATDISAEMTLACRQLQQFSEYTAPLTSEGGNHIKLYKIKVPDGCVPSKISFIPNDVRITLMEHGAFDTIVVSNVITEMASPKEFLRSVAAHVPPKGLLIIADPFLWEGGPEAPLAMNGNIKTLTHLQLLLEPQWSLRETTSMPFFVAQSERVATVASSEVSTWQRLQEFDSP